MKRVVIAEDEPITCMDLSDMLTELQFTVVGTASDGFDAIELCRQHRPDVVLMDVRMPVFDGLTAAEMILAEQTAQCVVLLTAFSDADIVERARRIGITAYLVKPINLQSLRPAIEIAIEQSQRLKQSREETEKLRTKLEEDRKIRKAQAILARTLEKLCFSILPFTQQIGAHNEKSQLQNVFQILRGDHRLTASLRYPRSGCAECYHPLRAS